MAMIFKESLSEQVLFETCCFSVLGYKGVCVCEGGGDCVLLLENQRWLISLI